MARIMETDRRTNQQIQFDRFLSNTVRLVGIGPTDIVDGNVTLTLGLMWSLIVFFLAKDLGDSGDNLSALKKR